MEISFHESSNQVSWLRQKNEVSANLFLYERKINFIIKKITTSLNIVVRKTNYVIIVSLYYIFGLHFPEALTFFKTMFKPMVILFIIKPYARVNIHKNVKQQSWVEKSVGYMFRLYAVFYLLFMASCALLQSYTNFNRLLKKNFLTCYSCSY